MGKKAAWGKTTLDDRKEFAEKLEALRARKKISANKFSKYLGICHSNYFLFRHLKKTGIRIDLLMFLVRDGLFGTNNGKDIKIKDKRKDFEKYLTANNLWTKFYGALKNQLYCEDTEDAEIQLTFK